MPSSTFLNERELFFKHLSLHLIGGDMCIDVPKGYHSRVNMIKHEMLDDDRTGLVASIFEFMVTTSTVDLSITTNNPTLTNILNDWKNNINSSMIEQIPSGVRALSNQYYRERWINSIAVLNISWKEDDKSGLILPDKMWFTDGCQLYVDGSGRTLGGYSYYIGKPGLKNSKKLPLPNTTILVRKSGASWYDKYPKPYLVRRGTAFHWKFKKMLVEQQHSVLKSMIPYILMAKKGTEALFLDGQDVDQTELEGLLTKLQQLKSDSKSKLGGKGLVGAFPFDTEIEHLMPDLKKLFNQEIIAPTDRSILASLGMIEVVEGISTSRKEAILNPKPLVEEIKCGVRDFQDILGDVLKMIRAVNIRKHPKLFTNTNMKITASTIKAFITNDMRVMIRSWYDRGVINKSQAVESTTDLDFEVQIEGRVIEKNTNIDELMVPYPIMFQPELGDGVPENNVNNPETRTSQPGLGTSMVNDIYCSSCDSLIDLEAYPEFRTAKIVKCPNCSTIIERSLYEEAPDHLRRRRMRRDKPCTPKDKRKKCKDKRTGKFDSNADLPKNVKSVLPQGAQTIWRKTFNSVFDNNIDKILKEREEISIRIAWSQVGKTYKKDPNGGKKWVKK